MITTDFTIANLSEEMSSDEIDNAFSNIAYAVSILKNACYNRLEELGYDEDTYEDGSNDNIEHILEVVNKLEEMSCHC